MLLLSKTLLLLFTNLISKETITVSADKKRFLFPSSILRKNLVPREKALRE